MLYLSCIIFNYRFQFEPTLHYIMLPFSTHLCRIYELCFHQVYFISYSGNCFVIVIYLLSSPSLLVCLVNLEL